MAIFKLKSAVAVLALAATLPAYANLVQVPGTQVTGTGLGAVSTLVTVQDNGNGNNQNGTESGCVSYPSGGDLSKPSFSCALGLQGGDNTALNRLYLASDIAGLTKAGNLAVVVNISEGQPGGTATLTNLYLSLYNTGTGQQMNFAYAGFPNGLPLVLGDSGGIGQSGANLFVLDGAQAAMANQFCTSLSACVIGGGIQFANGSTEATPETMYIASYTQGGSGGAQGGQVPEPMSILLVGAGLAGMASLRARKG